MSTWKGKDDCTDIILDLVAEHESRGNYNAVIGDVEASEDLGQYTLEGVFVLQHRLLNAGRPSSAVGRYQIILPTLHALVQHMQLDEGEKFTPELQDELGLELLKVRHYQGWWKGWVRDKQFAHYLSCEWASLPDPFNNGKSHYDGIGPNHAGTTLEHVYASLERARTAKNRASKGGRGTDRGTRGGSACLAAKVLDRG